MNIDVMMPEEIVHAKAAWDAAKIKKAAAWNWLATMQDNLADYQREYNLAVENLKETETALRSALRTWLELPS